MSCPVVGCERPRYYSKPWCRAHWIRYQKYGRVERLTDAERFWTYTVPQGDCIHWTGKIDRYGYGRFSWGPRSDHRQSLAHRYAYTLVIGLIPDGLTLDHVCHNADLDCAGGRSCMHRRCVNPSHLEPATRGDNARRGVSRHRMLKEVS